MFSSGAFRSITTTSLINWQLCDKKIIDNFHFFGRQANKDMGFSDLSFLRVLHGWDHKLISLSCR